MFQDGWFFLQRYGEPKKTDPKLRLLQNFVNIHPNFANNNNPNCGYDIALVLVELADDGPDLTNVFAEPMGYTY